MFCLFSAYGAFQFTIGVGSRFDPGAAGGDGGFNSRDFTVCAYVSSGSLSPGETRTYDCNTPVVGRYLAVYPVYSWGTIDFCDLQVHGHPSGEGIRGRWGC